MPGVTAEPFCTSSPLPLVGEVAVSAAGEGFLIRNLASAIVFVVGPLPALRGRPLPKGEVNNLLIPKHRNPDLP